MSLKRLRLGCDVSMVVRVFAASSIGAVVLAAGLPAAEAAGKPISVDFVSGPLNDSFFPPLYKGAHDAAHDLGVKLNYIPIDESDIEASSAQTMQAAIAQHPDAIVVGDFIPNVVDPYIKQAVAAGIPVYVDQSGQDQWRADGAFGFVGQQGPQVGSAAAGYLAKDGSKNILCVINVPGNLYLQSICRGLSARATALDLKSEALELPTADSTDQAQVSRDIGAYLQSHRDVDGIFTENAAVGTAAVAALDAAGTGDRVHVGTMEISKIALQEIQNGKLAFLVNEQPYLDGYYAVLFAAQYVKYGLAPVGAVSTGPSIVDKTNIDKILTVFNSEPDIIGSR